MKALVQTVGCRLNQYYSQLIRETLVSAGYQLLSSEPEEADLVVINACSVTSRAERDVRRKLHRAVELPNTTVILTGCASQELKGASGVEFMDYQQLAEHLGVQLARVVSGLSGRTRAQLRLQSGCDFRCSYCIVPQLRGGSVSRPLSEILQEASVMAEAGVPEMVLTGTQIGDWRARDMGLAELLKILTKEFPGIRFRLSSIEPTHITPQLIELMAQERDSIAPHLHVPLQSGSDKVLRDMNRPYDLKQYQQKVGLALREMPHMGLGTDIIVGFPTETREDFQASLSALKNTGFSYAHIFTYSPRPGTPAWVLGSLDPQLVRDRVREMKAVDTANRKAFAARFTGQELDVIGEVRVAHGTRGTSGNYIKVDVLGMRPGQRARVAITGPSDAGLMGRITQEITPCQR